MLRRLIITADDFGMSREVNEAVEEAHRRGVLTAASLVVTGEAAADAVERARRLPQLGVGLHLALLDAPAALSPSAIPDLLDETGSGLGTRPWATGLRIAMSKSVRRQARAEIEAQLGLFARTGLRLDHVDGHWHFHQHPAVTAALVDLAPRFGIAAVRVAYEPALASWRAAGRSGLAGRVLDALGHRALTRHMKRLLGRAGIACNDWFFGRNDGGAVTASRLIGFIDAAPAGVTEIGLHPARQRWRGPHAPPPHWRPEDELAALTDPAVIAACRRPGLELIRFADLRGRGAGATGS